jgi:hypothetical protein
MSSKKIHARRAEVEAAVSVAKQSPVKSLAAESFETANYWRTVSLFSSPPAYRK